MSLDFQTVDVRFTQGLDTKTQPKLVIPGKWSQLQNCSNTEDETPQRRDGIAALVASATGNGLSNYNNELLVINGKTLSSVTTAQTDAAVAKTGSLGYVDVSKDEVYHSTALVDSPDTAWGNGFSCHVWKESTNTTTAIGVKYTLIDETTGVKVFDGVNLSIGPTKESLCPRVVYSSDAFFIFWIEYNITPRLACVVVRVSGTPTQGANVNLINDANLPHAVNFDACSGDGFGLGQPLAVVAYPWGDGTTSVRCIGVQHISGVPSILNGPTNIVSEANQSNTSIAALGVALFGPAVGATRAGIFSMASAGALTGVVGTAVGPTQAVTTASTLIDGVVVSAGQSHLTAVANASNNLQVYYDQRAAQGTVAFKPVKTVTVDSTMTTIVSASTLLNSASFDQNAARASGPMGPWIWGKAFRVGTSFFLPMYVQEDWGSITLGALGANTRSNNLQCTFFLMDATTGVVVGKALYGTLGPDGTTNYGIAFPVNACSSPCSMATLSAGVFSVDVMERTRLSTSDGINVSQAGLVRLELTPNFSTSPISAQLGETTYLAGGQLTAYDGSNVVEHGWPLAPEGVSVVAVGSGGSMTAGVHQVLAVYEWVDGAGNLDQSAPCLAVSVTTVANDSLSVIIPALLISQKPGVKLVVFMTQAAGTTFNRVTPVYAPVANVTNASTVTVTVTSSDASIASNELLYTQPNTAGTTLPNVAPGPVIALGKAQNRLFFGKADQPGQFGYSQRYINNQALQFNGALSGAVDVSGGSFVGVESMDEKIIIFCSKKPFVMYGSGPDSSGGYATYGDPQEIPSDVGCVDAHSILKLPSGIVFKSAKGWYLLGRDLQTHYIGEGVSVYDANSVSSAVLLADRQEARFSSTSGTQLIYDYLGNEWSTTVYRASTAGVVTSVAAAAAAYSTALGCYVTVSLTHGLNKDTPGIFIDQPGSGTTAVSIITVARTAWLKMQLINGFQRVRQMFLTGTTPTAPTSTLTVAVDFDDSYGQVAPGSYTFSVNYGTMFPTFSTGATVDFRHHLAQQKCKSVAFTFTDTPTVASPAGVNFQALSLQLGMKRGLKKLPAAQST